MTLDLEEAGVGAAFGVLAISVLWRVINSLRSGINDWTDLGTLKRAPYEYDFWVVTALFGAIGVIFLAVSIFLIVQAVL